MSPPTGAVTAEPPRLDRDLLLFTAARMVAVAGSGITAVATTVLVYRLSGSAFLTSLVAAAQVAPYLVFGLLAGAMADRLPRRRVMVTSQGLCAVALLSIPAAHVGDHLGVAQVLLVALLLATGFVWFDAAAFGALPAIVGRDRLVAANSVVWTSTTIVAVAAPAVGGVVVVTLGPEWALAVDAAAYLLAAGLILRIAASMDPHHTRGTVPRPGTSIRADIAEGLRFVARHPLVRSLTLIGVGNSLVAGAVTALLVVFATEEVHVPSEGHGLGVMLAAVALGGLLAATMLSWLTARIPTGRLTLAALALGIPCLACLAAVPPYGVALALLVVWSCSSTLVILNGIAARQRVTPDHLQARVNTTARLVAWGGTPFGAVTGGIVAEAASVPIALAGAAAVLSVTVFLGMTAV
ncbi:MFS transporter [Nocardioides alcanivorans]|uniref:MFS transporter n=1 Tax=Nocardioides alcanivorans TaxID=2897352 RepID=UPI001F3D8454|nr:MFS transporter [Nocardioides alcanivorans]